MGPDGTELQPCACNAVAVQEEREDSMHLPGHKVQMRIASGSNDSTTLVSGLQQQSNSSACFDFPGAWCASVCELAASQVLSTVLD